MTAGLDLSVVVPLYNEEESLPELVDQLLKALRPIRERFELVLVNDGSTDNTASVLESISEQVPGNGAQTASQAKITVPGEAREALWQP